MNRDEQRSRPRAHGPKLVASGEAKFLYPYEPLGGTWIGVNDSAATYALVNWYAVDRKANGKAISRGNIIPSMLKFGNYGDASAAMQEKNLSKFNPFRLIGIFPKENQVLEWKWNLEKLETAAHGWTIRAWISSGHDEPQAQKVREKTFRNFLALKAAGTRQWMRRVHSSHLPEQGPFSICMHRADAATVSYTEVEFRGKKLSVHYHDGSLCEGKRLSEDLLALK